MMNKVGRYGAAFSICMMLCYIMGTGFDFKYMYLVEIVFALISGAMLYLAVSELYKDIRKQRQEQQSYIEGLKDIVRSMHDSLEMRVTEIGDVCQKQYIDLAENLTSYQETTETLIHDFSLENTREIKEINETIASAEKVYNLGQEEFIKEIRSIWREHLEYNATNQKNLAETLKSIESFVRNECYGLVEKFEKQNEILVEHFSDRCKDYVEKLYRESYDSLEKCNNLMDSYVIRQKELIKEIQQMHHKQLQHEKTGQELAEKTVMFIQDKMIEMQRKGDILVKEFGDKNQLYVQELAENYKTYTEKLQGTCLGVLQKCNTIVDDFGELCLNTIEENTQNSEELITKYNEDLSDSIDKNWRRISEATDRSYSIVDDFAQEIRQMMEKLIKTVGDVNTENSQYINQIKEYQKELKLLSSEDIKIMEKILDGNK